jgi:hypothetical protein
MIAAKAKAEDARPREIAAFLEIFPSSQAKKADSLFLITGKQIMIFFQE